MSWRTTSLRQRHQQAALVACALAVALISVDAALAAGGSPIPVPDDPPSGHTVRPARASADESPGKSPAAAVPAKASSLPVTPSPDPPATATDSTTAQSPATRISPGKVGHHPAGRRRYAPLHHDGVLRGLGNRARGARNDAEEGAPREHEEGQGPAGAGSAPRVSASVRPHASRGDSRPAARLGRADLHAARAARRGGGPVGGVRDRRARRRRIHSTSPQSAMRTLRLLRDLGVPRRHGPRGRRSKLRRQFPECCCNGGGCGGWFRSNVTGYVVVRSRRNTSRRMRHRQRHRGHSGCSDLTCSVTYPGGTVSASVTVAKDSGPPSVEVSLSRGPDGNGWYTKPVPYSFSGDGGPSGIAGCSTGHVLRP